MYIYSIVTVYSWFINIQKFNIQEAYPLLLQQSRPVTTHRSEVHSLQMQTVHVASYSRSTNKMLISCIIEVWQLQPDGYTLT